jgi:hypothetical protein
MGAMAKRTRVSLEHEWEHGLNRLGGFTRI